LPILLDVNLLPPSGPDAALSSQQNEALRALEDSMVAGRGRVAVITGPPGVGKTSVAALFAELHRDSFRGGVRLVTPGPAGGRSDLAWFVDQELESTQPSLLIIDEAHGLSDVPREVARLQSDRPELRILLVSNGEVPPTAGDETRIELGRFRSDEVASLLELDLQPERLEALWRWLGNRPPNFRELLRAIQNEVVTPEELGDAELVDSAVVLGPDGRPLAGHESEPLEVHVRSAAAELYELVQVDPGLLRAVTAREFEEIVAEYFTREGYEVTLTAASRDGGKDLYAAKQDGVGSFLYVVECKAYAPHERVGVHLVRHLYGVVQHENATAGILATTSYFTKPALAFEEDVRFRLSLRDFDKVAAWLSYEMR
jgi:restriction system protein